MTVCKANKPDTAAVELPEIEIPEEDALPWQDEKTLRTLYSVHKWSQQQIGDHLGCSDQTVSRWMSKFGIGTREEGVWFADRPRQEESYVRYEITAASGEDIRPTVSEHQLVAIADGADPHRVFADDTHCHHRNKHKADNRPCNVSVLQQSIHNTEVHGDEKWITVNGEKRLAEPSQTLGQSEEGGGD